uniref:VQ domain-containing protein n=1 Tax=Kalanchoe fedtschenkoi TaxID=63787 RepID=A0A7N0VF65_KALFE
MAASSENLAAMSIVDPFLLRQSFSADFWPSSADTETLTKALQRSPYSNFSFNAAFDDHFNLLLPPPPPDHIQPHHNQQQQTFSPFSDLDQQQQQYQQPISTPSASDPEASTTPKRRVAATARGRIAKRKSRATKKNLTTFIEADPANFRQMVQRVTGVRFDAASSPAPLPPLSQLLLKPEPRRPIGRLYSACLPTLDTSSFLLDYRNSHQSPQTQNLKADGPFYSSGDSAAASSHGGAAEALASFPTLESWKVM